MNGSVALQLYTVRQQLAKEFVGTLRRVRDIGYRAVETYPFTPQVPASMAGEVFKRLEMDVIAMHCALPLRSALPEILETADALDCRQVIWHGWPRSSEYDSSEGVRRLVAHYNEANAIARDNGLEFGLHNHWWEFEPMDGLYPYRILHELLHPDVFLELDTYWVQTAGIDPCFMIETLGSRIRLLHMKDGPAIHGSPMTPLGEGVVDFPAILRAVRHPVSLIVELDECATDIFQAVDRSYRYLETWVAQIPSTSFRTGVRVDGGGIGSAAEKGHE